MFKGMIRSATRGVSRDRVAVLRCVSWADCRSRLCRLWRPSLAIDTFADNPMTRQLHSAVKGATRANSKTFFSLSKILVKRPRSPGWRTNGEKVARPKTVNEGNWSTTPNDEPTPVHRFVYARHGRDCCGVKVPCTSLRVSRRSIYQMMAPIDKVLDEGNCGRATDRGEEACGCVRKCRPDFAAGHILVKAARLRTETPYKAGAGRRVSTTSRSRSQTPVQVNGELAQRNITLLSGEICRGGMRAVAAPMSRACPKTRYASAKAAAGAAEVSRGRSTDPRNPIETGRTKR